MTGELYIDGVDAFVEYGVFVRNAGYNGLLELAPLKKTDSNDWPEEDGIEADLSDTVLDSREFSISFACVNEPAISNMIALLSDRAYHEFDFREIGLIKSLRMVSAPNRQTVLNLAIFNIQFADDFPLYGYTYSPPISSISIPDTGYELDNIDFSKYGITILKGTYDEIMKMPAVKKNLLINTRNITGAIYDGENVTFQAKDVSLKCYMKAKNWAEFWNNYNALLYNLSKPNERMLYIDIFNDEAPCYYVRTSIHKFTFLGSNIWFEFDLVLRFTSFRIREIEYILTSQNDEFIESNDGQYLIAI